MLDYRITSSAPFTIVVAGLLYAPAAYMLWKAASVRGVAPPEYRPRAAPRAFLS